MNYIRRAAGTVTGAVSSAASSLPLVGSYFAYAPANNATRRNNRAAPAPAPVAAVNVPAVNVAAPAPASVAAAGGGSAGAAPEGTLARIRREKAERNAAAKAAANANMAARRGQFFAPNTRKVAYANLQSQRATGTSHANVMKEYERRETKKNENYRKFAEKYGGTVPSKTGTRRRRASRR